MPSTLVRYSPQTLFFHCLLRRFQNLRHAITTAMKFTYLALFCCALWTLASALPLGLLGSESSPRGSDQRVEQRSLYARTGSRKSTRLAAQSVDAPAAPAPEPEPDVPYAVSLRRKRIGTDEEHWALHFHPQQDGAGNLHILDGASDKRRKGVLRVEAHDMGVYTRPIPKAKSETHHIANFPSKAKAMEAMNDVKANVHLTEKFPEDNCVDFTCRAAQHMAHNGHITHAQAQTVVQLHTTHAAAVKKDTNTPENREKTGQ